MSQFSKNASLKQKPIQTLVVRRIKDLMAGAIELLGTCKTNETLFNKIKILHHTHFERRSTHILTRERIIQSNQRNIFDTAHLFLSLAFAFYFFSSLTVDLYFFFIDLYFFMGHLKSHDHQFKQSSKNRTQEL